MSLFDGSARPKRCIVGLGNPGSEYVDSRHNLGFAVVDELLRRHSFARRGELCGSDVAHDGQLLLAKPRTYMNRSGFAARCLVEELEMDPSSILIVYDEIDLPLGRIRMREGGSPAGHKGIASVLSSLETDRVPRLRLGIGPSSGTEATKAGCEAGGVTDVVSFVLGRFDPAEMAVVEEMVERAADACELWASSGAATAMQEFNR